jgi:hypothetical protein
MFGVPQFTIPRFKAGKQVPFFFVWLPRLSRGFRSAFGLTWRELQSDYEPIASRVKRNQAAAVLIEGQPHVAAAEGNSWTMHGIIAAQRRAAGHVWLVVSGLVGPATNAAASMVKEVTAELPWSKGKPSKVLWVPVKVEIKAGPASPFQGDVREVVKATFDGEPRTWPEEWHHSPERIVDK